MGVNERFFRKHRLQSQNLFFENKLTKTFSFDRKLGGTVQLCRIEFSKFCTYTLGTTF